MQQNKKTLDELFRIAHRENRKTKRVILILFVISIVLSIFTFYYIFILLKKTEELSNKLDFKFQIFDDKIRETERGLVHRNLVLSEQIEQQIELNNKQFDNLERKIEKQEKKITEIQKFFKSPYQIKEKQYPKNIAIANALIDRGLSKENAAAVTGNIMVESSGNFIPKS